jgi:hypothetical protein
MSLDFQEKLLTNVIIRENLPDLLSGTNQIEPSGHPSDPKIL